MKILSTFILASFVLTIGCVNGVEQDSLTTANDHEATPVADCFTKLLAGSVASSGELTTVAFANGACQGTSKALNKLSEAKTVDVLIDGDKFESRLFKNGEKIEVEARGQRIAVATWAANSDSNELVLAAGARVQLRVGAEIWELGTSSGGSERVEITLN